ncbi:MAG: DUF3365 domain-containing protein [Rhizobiales bacterium]|nr:DUF3365 domain-containing protein [Hyphomicrobiales bacterium]
MSGGHSAPWARGLAVLLVVMGGLAAMPARAAGDDEAAIASHLAEYLRSARTVISQYQDLINDPQKGDKGLTPDRVIAEATALYEQVTGEDPMATDPAGSEGRLLRAQMQAIRDVMAEHEAEINEPGTGFKGFIPAVFARLVNEKFADAAGSEARVKTTAPADLVRNRKARPDAWENAVIEEKFEKPDWPRGKGFSETTEVDGRPAFRLIVPEYYKASCLACHGEPKGEMDITGYPKEGGKEGDLGSAISVTLFQ